MPRPRPTPTLVNFCTMASAARPGRLVLKQSEPFEWEFFPHLTRFFLPFQGGLCVNYEVLGYFMYYELTYTRIVMFSDVESAAGVAYLMIFFTPLPYFEYRSTYLNRAYFHSTCALTNSCTVSFSYSYFVGVREREIIWSWFVTTIFRG